MNIIKLNKQLEAHIYKQVLNITHNVHSDIGSILESYLKKADIAQVDDDLVEDLCASVDQNLHRNTNKLLKKLIASLEHYIEQKANLAALKGCYLEDEESEEEYPYLSESEEFEDSEITKI